MTTLEYKYFENFMNRHFKINFSFVFEVSIDTLSGILLGSLQLLITTAA